MKKISTIASLIFLMFQSKAQNVGNPSFDSVYIGGIDRIYEWITSDSWQSSVGDTVLPLMPFTHYISSGLQYHEALNTVQIEFSSAFDGPLAVKLFSDSDRVKSDGTTFSGFVINGNHFYTDSTGYIDFSKGGEPFPYRPYSLKGHYKFEDQSPSLHNYPHAFVLLKKFNSLTQTSDTIGFSELYIQLFATSSWRAFEMPINYFSNDVPDSVVLGFISSPAKAPATLWIDSLGFDYDFPSQIKETDINKGINFYIDQTSNRIYFLNTSGIISVKIYDLKGSLCLSSYSFYEVDISNLENNLYLMKVETTGSKIESFRISKR
jgi:hypothetical protein